MQGARPHNGCGCVACNFVIVDVREIAAFTWFEKPFSATETVSKNANRERIL